MAVSGWQTWSAAGGGACGGEQPQVSLLVAAEAAHLEEQRPLLFKIARFRARAWDGCGMRMSTGRKMSQRRSTRQALDGRLAAIQAKATSTKIRRHAQEKDGSGWKMEDGSSLFPCEAKARVVADGADSAFEV
jgi:hypothetical protein